ncbi:hypothetical protein IWQ62_002215 [Dispira parvispora]|uniref:Uncharacterized protein n=1 Tax=Dispira parvispora TaxID=1520584 RepID=A0A9W8AWJ3_9FUNG|nr:hypothetical protein IWQ62_002215 [Dispira parvispora]
MTSSSGNTRLSAPMANPGMDIRVSGAPHYPPAPLGVPPHAWRAHFLNRHIPNGGVIPHHITHKPYGPRPQRMPSHQHQYPHYPGQPLQQHPSGAIRHSFTNSHARISAHPYRNGAPLLSQPRSDPTVLTKPSSRTESPSTNLRKPVHGGHPQRVPEPAGGHHRRPSPKHTSQPRANSVDHYFKSLYPHLPRLSPQHVRSVDQSPQQVLKELSQPLGRSSTGAPRTSPLFVQSAPSSPQHPVTVDRVQLPRLRQSHPQSARETPLTRTKLAAYFIGL